MDSPEHKELERFIDEQLRKLPEREAPAELIASVMQSLAAREKRPWYKQPFTEWNRGQQSLLILALAFLAGGATWLAWAPAEQLTSSALADQIRPYGWIGSVAELLASSVILTFRSLPMLWLGAIAAGFVAIYAACVSAGVALYRVTSLASQRPHTAS
jgi:hypothetical protein